jgi:hypothetical protein
LLDVLCRHIVLLVAAIIDKNNLLFIADAIHKSAIDTFRCSGEHHRSGVALVAKHRQLAVLGPHAHGDASMCEHAKLHGLLEQGCSPLVERHLSAAVALYETQRQRMTCHAHVHRYVLNG